MEKPFPAYAGTESYVFVCYAHMDAVSVYSDLVQLDCDGIHVWYDEGIPAGTSWRAEIAAAIKGATKFLFFISESSLNSAHCLREIDYALNNDIEIIPVYLDDSNLPPELELGLNRVQALFRSSDSEYMQHLQGALQRSSPFAPLLPIARKRNLRIGLTILGFGFSLLVLFFWTQRNSIFPSEQIVQSPIAVPNAYEGYLEGLELMDRWDKDDNLDRAIGLFRDASTRDPSFALAFAGSAEALRIRYVLTGDEAWLNQATSAVDEAMRLNADLAPVQVALGRIHTARGNIDLAFAALERALAIDANHAGANATIATVYVRMGRLEDAKVSIEKAVALNPESLSILNQYANFLYDLGLFEDATRQWQAIISLAPDHYAALINLGTVLDETDRIPEAIALYQRSIEIRPTYLAYSNLGTVYSREERYLEAVDAYRQALEIDDMDWLAWGNLAFVYSWMNGMDPQATETFERAIQLAETARQRNPREPYVHSDLALYYAKTQQVELALQRLGTAIVLAPESANILAAAAEAYELIGQRDDAVEFARKSLELGFTSKQLQRSPELSDLLTDPRMQ